jgi:50S ribosomal subunit-associated GTPase HflX
MVQWRNELISSRGEDIRLVIAANKIDLKERVIKAEQGQQFARANNSQYFEVSAKTGYGIESLFAHVAELLASIPPEAETSMSAKRRQSKVTLQVVDGDGKKKGGCC